jgi:hypothetical protein
MPELEIRLGTVRLIGDRIAIRSFGRGAIAGFLQRVAVLYPDWRVARLAVERDAVKARSGFPLSCLASTIGAADNRRLAAVGATEQRHSGPTQLDSGSWVDSGEVVRLSCPRMAANSR